MSPTALSPSVRAVLRQSVAKKILLLVGGFASQAAVELPFLITRHSHTTAEQLIRAGSKEAILVRVKGL